MGACRRWRSWRSSHGSRRDRAGVRVRRPAPWDAGGPPDSDEGARRKVRCEPADWSRAERHPPEQVGPACGQVPLRICDGSRGGRNRLSYQCSPGAHFRGSGRNGRGGFHRAAWSGRAQRRPASSQGSEARFAVPKTRFQEIATAGSGLRAGLIRLQDSCTIITAEDQAESSVSFC